MLSLREKFFRGVFWVIASRALAQVVQFGTTLILARLLYPRDFGLFAMVGVAMSVSWSFAELGLTTAIVQARSLTREAEISAFWVTLGAGFLVGGVLFCASQPLAAVYGEEIVTPLARTLAFATPITAAAVVPHGILLRRLDFKGEGYTELARVITYGGVALPMAAAGAGVWALVSGELAGAAVRTLTAFGRAGWSPALEFKFRSVVGLVKFGANVSGAGLALAAKEQVDKFIIARTLGAQIVGGYSLALKVATVPQHRVARMIERVTFPAFASIQCDRVRMAAVYNRVVATTALMTLPFLAWLAATARPFVEVVLGSRWVFIATPLAWLCVAGGFYALTTPVRSVILAAGKPGWEFGQHVLSLAATAVAVWLGTRYGFVWVAAAFAMQAIFVSACYQMLGLKVLGQGAREFFRGLAFPFGLALLTGGVTAVTVSTVSRVAGPVATLLLALGVGVSVVAAGVAAARPAGVRESVAFLRARLCAAKSAYFSRLAWNGKKGA